MAYKFQLGAAKLGGTLEATSIDNTNVDDATAANVVAQIDDKEIAVGKLALANAKLVIGDGAGKGVAQSISGDAALAANGALSVNSVQASAVVYASLAGAALGTVADNSATKLVNSANIKSYVDSVAQGLDIKDSVKAATTGNITLSGTQTIDGVGILADDRVLVKDQSTGSQNGIYLCKAGAWARANDFDTGEDEAGAFTFIEQGTVNAESGWVCTNNKGGGVVGTDALAFSQFSGAGAITAGTGLSKSGNTLNLDIDELPVLNAAPALASKFAIDESGLKEVTMERVSEAAFARVSGDVQIAAGGAATIQATSVEGSMLNSNVTQNANGLEINSSKLKILLASGNNGLNLDASGLQIAAAGVRGSMLNGDCVQNANGLEINGNRLKILLAGGGPGLALAADGLKIDAGGVTDAMLAGSITNAKLQNNAIAGVALGGSAADMAAAVDGQPMALTALTALEMQNNANYTILDIGSNTLTLGADAGFVKVAGKLEARYEKQTFTANGNIAVGKPYVIATKQGSDITLTLPAAATSDGMRFFVKAKGNGAGDVIIDGNASETIDGATSITLESQDAAVQVFCDGAAWYVY